MEKSWEADEATKSQISYLKYLIESKGKYLLKVNLNDLSKGRANDLIQALLHDDDEKLLSEKILEKKLITITKEEVSEKQEEPTNEKLVSTIKYPKGRYKIIGNMHLWSWMDFKSETGGDIAKWDTAGSIINSITFDFENEIEGSILEKYGLIAESIKSIE